MKVNTTITYAGLASTALGWGSPPIYGPRNDFWSPGNLTNIRTFSAVGDSFPTGVGAGKRLGSGLGPIGNYAWECRHFDQSYPMQINNNERFGPTHERQFMNLACGGYDIPRTLEYQLPHLRRWQDVITLSIGGNDIGFKSIIDACVIGMKPASMGANKCEMAIQKGHSNIQDLAPQWDKILAVLSKKLTPDTGRLYMTGYGNYFDVTTVQCDKVCFAPINWFHRKRLFKIVRKRLTVLVDALNVGLEAATKRAGKQVVFVSWDQDIVDCHGRACEEGVDEPNRGRLELMFFEPWYSSVDTMTQAAHQGKSLETELLASSASSARPFLPVWLVKSFHPKPNGHAVIAKRVLGAMEKEAGRKAPVVANGTCILSKKEMQDLYFE